VNRCTIVTLAKCHSSDTCLSQPVHSKEDTAAILEGKTGDVLCTLFPCRSVSVPTRPFSGRFLACFYYTMINFLTEQLWNTHYTQIFPCTHTDVIVHIHALHPHIYTRAYFLRLTCAVHEASRCLHNVTVLLFVDVSQRIQNRVP
jgi:hypothetical protein